MSLRARLLALLIGLAAFGLIVVGAVSYAALRDQLYDRVDKQAVSALEPLARELSGHGGPGPGGRGGGPPDGLLPGGTYGAVRDETGRVIEDETLGFGRFKREAPELPDDIPLTTDGDRPRAVDADGYRVIAVALRDGNTLVAAIPLTDVDETLGDLLRILVIVAAAVLLALAAAAFWLVRLGLSPLERMGRTAGAIAAGDLSRRVEPATEQTEVGRLGLALNRMLGQIETAFREREQSEERLRRFLSDASHELRTPLASIRGYAELYRIGAARRPEDQEKAMVRIEAEATRMGVLVEDLLTLARMDEERELLREEVDLSRLARESVEAARATAPNRELSVAADGPVVVEGDPGRLRQVVDNLVGNAIAHTPAGTPVEVRVTAGERGPRPGHRGRDRGRARRHRDGGERGRRRGALHGDAPLRHGSGSSRRVSGMRRALLPLAAAGLLLTTAVPSAGARVRTVRADSPAARAGLQPGDEILVAGGRDVRDEADLSAALEVGGRGGPMAIAVRRDGGIRVMMLDA